MSAAAVLMPLPALVPLIGAALTLAAGRKPRLQRAIALVALLTFVPALLLGPIVQSLTDQLF